MSLDSSRDGLNLLFSQVVRAGNGALPSTPRQPVASLPKIAEETASPKAAKEVKPEPLNEKRIEKRQRQIDIGKMSVGYQHYTKAVPKNDRVVGVLRHPVTPNKLERVSKRNFDAKMKSWRRYLHLWDDPNVDRAEEASLVLQASEEQSEPAPSFVGGKKEAQDYLSFPLTSQAALEASQAELRESQAALEASQAELRVSQAALQASQAELRVSQAALQASRAALQESKEGARAEIAALRIFISGETKSMKEAILEGVRVEREATMQEARNVKRSREESDQIRQIVLQCENQKRTIERLESDLRAAELEKVPVHNLDSGEQETMNIKKRKLDRDEGSASALYDIVKVKSELVHDQQDEMKYRDLFIDKQQSKIDQLEERLSEARNAGEQDAQTIKGLVENIEALTEENKKQMRQSRQAQTKKKR